MIASIRRSKTQREKPKKLTIAQDFWDEHLNGALVRAGAAYGFIVPFPLYESERAIWLDGQFGMAPLCEHALAMWQERQRLVNLIADPEFQAAREAARHHSEIIPPAPRSNACYFVIPKDGMMPGVIFRMQAPSFYPQGEEPYHIGYTYNFMGGVYSGRWDCLRAFDSKRASESDRVMAAEIRAWVLDNVANAQRARRAFIFLHNAMRCSRSTRAMLDQLPGLRDALTALGLPEWAVDGASVVSKTNDVFDLPRFRGMEPAWTQDWAEVRTTLMMMGAARSHAPNVPHGTMVATLADTTVGDA